MMAKGASKAADAAARAASAAEQNAQRMAAESAEESAVASQDEAAAEALQSAYVPQVARELAAAKAAVARAAARAASRVERAAKTAGSVIKKAATTAGKAIYKASGIQSIVSCVTNPNLASCVRAAVTVVGLALTIATGGLSVGVEVGVDAATDAAADAATDMATDSAADATEDVTDETGGDALDSSRGAGGKVWDAMKVKTPGIQSCNWVSALSAAASAISPMLLCRGSEAGTSWEIRLWAPLLARSATPTSATLAALRLAPRRAWPTHSEAT